MELIKIRNSDDIVRIEITPEFLGAWKYIFISFQEFEYSSSVIPQMALPHKYELGSGSDLVGTADTWRSQFINQSNGELEYSLTIKWFQGNDANPLHTWTTNKDGAKKKIESDTTKRPKDSCVYLKIV